MRILTWELKWVALGILIALSLALGISSTPMAGTAYAHTPPSARPGGTLGGHPCPSLNLRWGDMKHDSATRHAAILWGIPEKCSWENACELTRGPLGTEFERRAPTRCKNTGFNIWGVWEDTNEGSGGGGGGSPPPPTHQL
jgi:hypothetical protein